MAINVLTHRAELTVGSGTLLTAAASERLTIDWIMTDGAAELEIWFGATQTAANTILHSLVSPKDVDYRSPSKGGGLLLDDGEDLKYVAAGTAKVVIGYHRQVFN